MNRVQGDDRDLPAGWTVGRDNWACRPVRDSDRPKEDFAHSCNAFRINRTLFCRSAAQAEVLDAGGKV